MPLTNTYIAFCSFKRSDLIRSSTSSADLFVFVSIAFLSYQERSKREVKIRPEMSPEMGT